MCITGAWRTSALQKDTETATRRQCDGPLHHTGHNIRFYNYDICTISTTTSLTDGDEVTLVVPVLVTLHCAIATAHFGDTKLVASMNCSPTALRRLMNSTLMSAAMCSRSFCDTTQMTCKNGTQITHKRHRWHTTDTQQTQKWRANELHLDVGGDESMLILRHTNAPCHISAT